MKHLTKEELLTLWEENTDKIQHYKKFGQFLYRSAIEGEAILTIVSGKLETIKVAGVQEVVLRNITINSSAETYVIAEKMFFQRYTPISKQYKIEGTIWYVAEAKGEAYAFLYSGETITFEAPWGEPMVCEKGDYIASPVAGKSSDIYRIEKQTFKDTYRLYENH